MHFHATNVNQERWRKSRIGEGSCTLLSKGDQGGEILSRLSAPWYRGRIIKVATTGRYFVTWSRDIIEKRCFAEIFPLIFIPRITTLYIQYDRDTFRKMLYWSVKKRKKEKEKKKEEDSRKNRKNRLERNSFLPLLEEIVRICRTALL